MGKALKDHSKLFNVADDKLTDKEVIHKNRGGKMLFRGSPNLSSNFLKKKKFCGVTELVQVSQLLLKIISKNEKLLSFLGLGAKTYLMDFC